MRLADLPFGQVWLVDFEYYGPDHGRKTVVCMVAHEVRSGRRLRLWKDQLPARPPFDTGPDSLFIAYQASAEMMCFIELGWHPPARVLDLYAETIHGDNGRRVVGPMPSLLTALTHYDLPQYITADQKTEMRDLILSGGPWSASQRREILDYCELDVLPLGPLAERMLPYICRTREGLGQALLRGRYMTALARIERTGIPIDVEAFALLQEHRDELRASMIAEVNPHYRVYEDGTFKYANFERYLDREGIQWPRTDRGQLKVDSETFDRMALVHPQVEALGGLRYFVDQLKPDALQIGPDGRNRAFLKPFGTITGRNNGISGNKLIFGLPAWLRSLIRPRPDRSLAYIDWSAQEVAIAAVLSNDKAMLAGVESGDPYLNFAKLAGMVPPDATKESHKTTRDQCKRCVLGTNYGMGIDNLAVYMGCTRTRAKFTRMAMRQTFPTYTEWSEAQVNEGRLRGQLVGRLGWTLQVIDATKSNTLRNFPMQANGAEMMRLACCLTTERGVEIAVPVHDALLVEADTTDITDVVDITRASMLEASKVVLDGFEIGTDVKLTHWPDRYVDGRGIKTWQRVARYLEGVRRREEFAA